LSGNKQSIDAMSIKNKGTAVAFIPIESRITRISVDEYEKLKKVGLAFHSGHPVTRLFRAIESNYSDNFKDQLDSEVSCYLPLVDRAEKLKMPAFWALQGYNLAVSVTYAMKAEERDKEACGRLAEFARKSLLLASRGEILPTLKATWQTRRLVDGLADYNLQWRG
jgi:hypothetical protein